MDIESIQRLSDQADKLHGLQLKWAELQASPDDPEETVFSKLIQISEYQAASLTCIASELRVLRTVAVELARAQAGDSTSGTSDS